MTSTTTVRKSPWRGIRAKLVLVLLIPTAASLALAGARLQNSWQDAQAATRAESLARALPDTYTLALLLQQERDLQGASTHKQLARAIAMTDQELKVWRGQVARVDASHSPGLAGALTSIDSVLNHMDSLRQQAADLIDRDTAKKTYTNVIDGLLDLPAQLPTLADQSVMRQVEALANVGPAAQAVQDARVQVTTILVTNHTDIPTMTSLAASAAEWQTAVAAFTAGASPRAQAQFDQLSDKVAAPVENTIQALLSGQSPAGTEVTPERWNKQVAAYFAAVIPAIRTAATDLSASVSDRRHSARTSAAGSALLILLMLLLVVVEVAIASRSIVRPLGRLRQAALEVADRRLPERVRDLESSDDLSPDVEVEPLGIGKRDEIAEVAAAFDAVHGQAVRLAAEQAQMRANINKMVANLSRRSHRLVERQLRLIDELERNEQDPDHLANLFRLDHLATRMRRNDESLMVLAGGGGAQPARGEVRVLDVLRAASSEVEQYDRVQIDAPVELRFKGSAAGDLVHLLAELVENATNFSPPESPVVVRAQRSTPTAGLVVEVIDTGIGMSPGELAAANRKLERASALDADVARMMGLVVVARLAARHRLIVDLRPNAPRGIIARVSVPPAVLGGADDVLSAPAAAAPLSAVPSPTPGAVPALAPALPAAAAPLPARTVPAADDVSDPLGTLGAPRNPEPAVPDPLTAPTTFAAPLHAGPETGTAATSTAPEPLPKRQPAALVSTDTPARALEAPVVEATADAAPVASAPQKDTWFTPINDPETLLNAFLTGGPQRGSTPDPSPARTAATASHAAAPAQTPAETRSPIFESLQSEWFVNRTATDSPAAPQEPPSTWTSPGDAGWRRAAELHEAAMAQRRAAAPDPSGALPTRVPGRNLIAGSADEAPQITPPAARDARRTGALSGFQQGVSRARTLRAVDDVDTEFPITTSPEEAAQ